MGRSPAQSTSTLLRFRTRYEEVPKDSSVYVFCGSGLRSMIAASFLQRNGWKNLAVILGGMSGWKSIKCPISK